MVDTPRRSLRSPTLIKVISKWHETRRTAGRSRTVKNEGFSLIEFLIASLVVMILLLGAGELILRSRLVKQRCDLRTICISLVSTKLESLMDLPFGSPELEEGMGEETFTPEGMKLPFRLSWAIDNLGEDLKRVILHCRPETLPEREIGMMVYIVGTLEF